MKICAALQLKFVYYININLVIGKIQLPEEPDSAMQNLKDKKAVKEQVNATRATVQQHLKKAQSVLQALPAN